MAKQTFSMRWQVLHSKVCSSKPLLPGEIRANPILCLQVRHIGRSIMEDELRIAQHPEKRYELSTNRSVRCPTFRQILAQAAKSRGRASRSKAASNRVLESRQNRGLASEGSRTPWPVCADRWNSIFHCVQPRVAGNSAQMGLRGHDEAGRRDFVGNGDRHLFGRAGIVSDD